MRARYRLIRRGTRGGLFYCVDSTTGKRTSLATRNEEDAQQIVQAKNQALRQPMLNLQIARAYLAGTDSGITTRTWRQAMEALTATKQAENRKRWQTVAKDKAFQFVLDEVIIQTEGELLLKVLKRGTVSTNVYLRRLHNFCLDMNWLPWPIIPKRQWPAVRYGDKRAITLEEHQQIIAVRDAFAAAEDSHAGGCPRDCIDSTIATLAIALDVCTVYGEGLLIANDATLKRLLFATGAPYAALARRVWAYLTIPGNPMTGIDHCKWVGEPEGGAEAVARQVFHTGVIYFAREHTVGPKHFTAASADPATLTALLANVRQWRHGAELRSEYAAAECLEPWQAVKERVAELKGREPKVPWNLWLTAGGTIRTALSRFEEVSIKVNKKEAVRLFALNDKGPMELVLQRAQRDELLHVAEKAGWRVQPELLEAVHAAVQQYHAARAPLYPLPEIQRLGYLDEQDTIECKLDLRLANLLVFQAGRSYPIRTQTVEVKRTLTKPNSLTGLDEDIELSGQELAIFLKAGSDEEPEEFCFMDARLREDKHTEIPNAKSQKNARPNEKPRSPIDFTLQDLCAHFIIPDVPDVATVNPKGYEHHLELLTQLETLTA